jgi:transposase InsO family protein
MKLRGKFARIHYIDSPNGGGNGGKKCLVHITDPAIPADVRAAYFTEVIRRECAAPTPAEDLAGIEIESNVYASLPSWARGKVDKYLSIISAGAGMKGAALRAFVGEWNAKNPGNRTSYQRVVAARKIYRERGVIGLAGKWGRLANRKGTAPAIRDEWFDYFKTAFLIEGGPSLKSCWLKTAGFARRGDSSFDLETFPSAITFLRRLESEIPEETIYLARHGRADWNRRYASYIERDLSALAANECWVGDHHQADIAVRLPSGKVIFPWLTGWIDFKTTKVLNLFPHPEAPNSDHIFLSFYRAARRFGLPTDLYIDNGKDYRAKDFAGGRTYLHRVAANEGKSTAMVAQLGIEPHFSLPYRAQSKTIERTFLKFKEWVSKGLPGYRGGNTVEKPEKLAEEIRTGKILEWDQFVALLAFAVERILNRMPSDGKALCGMCADEAWEKEAPVPRMVGADALKLFCMRTSKPVTIGRNGVRDSEIGRTYWGEWMVAMKGSKVYLRRDPESYQDAWAFRAEDDEYLGQAVIAEQVDALARTPQAKAALKEAQARNRHREKMVRSFLPDPEAMPAPQIALEDFAAGIQAVNERRGYIPSDRTGAVVEPARTAMDEVIARRREMERAGTMDISAIVPIAPARKKLYMFESDKRAAEGQS